jgi:hypothetical protein
MSVPFEAIVPPPSVPPLDNTPPDPDRIAGEERLPDPEPDEGPAATRQKADYCATWGLLCSGVRLQTEGRT